MFKLFNKPDKNEANTPSEELNRKDNADPKDSTLEDEPVTPNKEQTKLPDYIMEQIGGPTSRASNNKDKQGKQGKQIDPATEQSLQELVDKNRDKLINGELSHNEMVDMYLKLAAPHMNEKQKLKLKVKLIKASKPVLRTMLLKALKISGV